MSTYDNVIGADRHLHVGWASSCAQEEVFRFGLAVFVASGAGTLAPNQIPHSMPAMIPADQAYYWSASWQQDIRDSMAALDAGDFEDFDSDDPNDVVRWFLSDD